MSQAISRYCRAVPTLPRDLRTFLVFWAWFVTAMALALAYAAIAVVYIVVREITAAAFVTVVAFTLRCMIAARDRYVF